MSAIATDLPRQRHRSPMTRSVIPLKTLVARRFALTARTPRELVVPLLTPVLFALVIAPALKKALHTNADYESFVAVGRPAHSVSCSPHRSRGRCSCSPTSSLRSRRRACR